MNPIYPANSVRRDFIDGQFIALYDQQSLNVPLGLSAAMLFIAIIAAQYLSPWMVGAWYLAILGLQWNRFRAVRSMRRRQDLNNAQRIRQITVISGLNGISQACCLVVFPWLTVVERAAYSVVILGLATGALATNVGHRSTLRIYVLLMLGPLIAMWAWSPGIAHGSWMERSLAILISLYAITLLGLARQTFNMFAESCDIRFKERALNEQLHAALDLAQRANSAKTRFLAAASHDLRQPLHTITLLVAALSMRPVDERSRSIIDLLQQISETLSAQLDGLLDISKLDAGVVQVNTKPVRLGELVERHFSEISDAITAKGLTPRLQIRADGWVETDPELLRRILRNLTQNAIKFTVKGHVALAVGCRGDRLELTVQDSGLGISHTHQEQVFQEFYQVHNPERDRSKGLGLGLSIVRRLADLLGIELKMVSTPGRGTNFTLLLPMTQATAPEPESARVESAPQRFDLLVLVVDDELSVRSSVRILLEEWGCRCLEASGTEDALRVTASNRPDLLLADFRLREHDSGIATIEAVRRAWPHLPAVLISGDTAPDRLTEAERAGVRLLHKPLPPAVLRDLLREADLERDLAKEYSGEGTP